MNPYLILHPSPEGFAGTILWAETWEEANDRADERFTGLNNAFWITEATPALLVNLRGMCKAIESAAATCVRRI